MMVSRCLVGIADLDTLAVCSALSASRCSSRVRPSTVFIGVRISWLMLARNSLLARLAASAASRACASELFSTCSCRCASLSSVMSCTSTKKPTTSPSRRSGR